MPASDAVSVSLNEPGSLPNAVQPRFEPPFVNAILIFRAVFYGLTSLVVVAFAWFGGSFPTRRLVFVAVLSAVTSAIAGWIARPPFSGSRLLTALLVYDALALTLLLAPTGGVANPFTMLYFCQVTLSAVSLPPWGMLVVVTSASLGYGSLFWGGDGIHEGEEFNAHLQGMWLAFTITALVIGGFVSQLTQALLREREMRARAARLLGLTTLAAGAAHEIGNPLGTIKLVASDLERELRCSDSQSDAQSSHQSEWADDARVIVNEVDRARDVLRKMARGAGEIDGEGPREVSVGELMRGIKERLESVWPRVLLELDERQASLRIPLQATAQAIAQLVRNGFEASESEAVVEVRTLVESRMVRIMVEDSGEGMTPEVRDRVGEPFFTTKAPGHGTGLGVFLARTLVEQIGGRFEVSSWPARGTLVTVDLPRSDV